MTDIIQGFISKKTGKSFGAKLTYDSAQKRITSLYEKKK
ncbi:DNA topoisomerase 1 [Bacillus mycoides]|uniref:DNA topoisomerase 1 n=1 Tax=Bacillus mycoides TaxID=1405 RepID=C2Y447_BACMY|nr:DNA topoisomerase 1 [Bacillus mycoides]